MRKVGCQFPNQGWNPLALPWKRVVSHTGPPGESHVSLVFCCPGHTGTVPSPTGTVTMPALGRGSVSAEQTHDGIRENTLEGKCQTLGKQGCLRRPRVRSPI